MGNGDKTNPASDNKGIWVAAITALGAVLVALVANSSFKGDKQGQPKNADQRIVYQRVVNSNNQPVIGAVVKITEDDHSPYVRRSDSEGHFTAPLEQNTQIVRVEIDAKGFEDYIRDIPVAKLDSGDVILTPVRRESSTEKRQPPVPMFSDEGACDLYSKAKVLNSNHQYAAAEQGYRSALSEWNPTLPCDRAYIYKDLGYVLVNQKRDYRESFNYFLRALSEPLAPSARTRDDSDVYRGLAVAMNGASMNGDGVRAAISLSSDVSNGCNHYVFARFLDSSLPDDPIAFDARVSEYRKAIDTWIPGCGDKGYVYKDLVCAYAKKNDQRAKGILNDVPANDASAQRCAAVFK